MRQRTSFPVITGIFLLLATAIVVPAQEPAEFSKLNNHEVTIPVLVHPHDDDQRKIAERIRGEDFAVIEEGRRQEIIRVLRPDEAPLQIAVVIQDNLTPAVGNEIEPLEKFIRSLPQGSSVMTGYLSTGSLRVRAKFTTNLEEAADSLRIPLGSSDTSPYFLYSEVVEAIRTFDAQPPGRKALFLISDGLDAARGLQSASPAQSIDLDRAIREAQRRGIAVFAFYAPGVGLSSRSRLAASFGQGSLNRLADETGGQAFFSGTTFVTFDPYFRELRENLANLWAVTYRSTTKGDDFRSIEVTTEQNIHLHHPDGYKPKS